MEEELQTLLSLTKKRTFKDYQRIAALSNLLGRHPNRDWDPKDEAEIAILLAQYESIRNESLQTIANRVKIMLLGLGAIGALIGGSLTIKKPDEGMNVFIILAVFSIIIPLICIFILIVWAGEAIRSARAGYFLASTVEAQINQKMGRFVMTWETALWAGKLPRDEMWGPSMVSFLFFGIMALAAPCFGVLLSGGTKYSLLWFDIAIIIPYFFLILSGLYILKNLHRLRKKKEVKSVWSEEMVENNKEVEN